MSYGPFGKNAFRFFASAIVVMMLGGCGTLQRFKMEQQTTDARALTYEGLSALDRGQSDRASELFLKAAELSPDDHRVHENLAKSLSEEGNIDQAIVRLQKAVELSSDEPRLHVQLGKLYMQKRVPNLAERHSRLALKNDRRNFEAWKLLGMAQAAVGNNGEALRSLHRAATYNNDDKEIPYELARIYQLQGRNSQALAAIDSLRRRYPADREPIELLTLEGEVLLSLNRPQRVISRLAKVADREDISAESLLVLCQAYSATGDFSNARLAAALASDNFPSDARFATLLSNLPISVGSEFVDSGTIRQ